jgi:hypothetical protein
MKDTPMKHFVLATALVFSVLNAHAASSPLPEGPKPHAVFTKTDWALSAGIFATRAADYLSTMQGVREPARFREASLPQVLVHNHIGFASYEFASASLEVLGAYELSKMGHKRIARVVLAVNVGYIAKCAANNYELDWHSSSPR